MHSLEGLHHFSLALEAEKIFATLLCTFLRFDFEWKKKQTLLQSLK